MAKARAKAKKTRRFESLGWGFWLICFVVLFGPCWYLGYKYSYADQQGGALPWAVGIMLAAVGAGLLSLGVNYLLLRSIEAEKKRARKAAR